MTQDVSFEKAFTRLEKILEQMNEGKVSLEAAMKLFEEGDLLINKCDQYLNAAQKKIEVLLKNRNGQVITNEQNEIEKQDFAPSQDSL